MIRALFPAVLVALFALQLTAQEQLRVSQPDPGTIRLNDSAIVSITVEGKSANPRITKLPAVPGLEIRKLPKSTRSISGSWTWSGATIGGAFV